MLYICRDKTADELLTGAPREAMEARIRAWQAERQPGKEPPPHPLTDAEQVSLCGTLYAADARIEGGTVVVDRWVSRAEAASMVPGYVGDPVLLATLGGYETTLFEAPAAPEPRPVDPEAERRARVAAHLDAQARAAIDSEDILRARDVLALMSDEERARWSAPDPVQDAAEALDDALRPAPSFLG